MTRPHSRAAGGFLIAALLMATARVPGAAAGQSSPNQPDGAAPAAIPAPGFITQSPLVSTEGTFTIEFSGPPDLSSAALIHVTSYPPISTRNEVRSFISQPRPKRMDQLEVAVVNVPRSVTGTYLMTIPVEQIDRDATHLQLKGPGLFPLAVEFVDDGVTSAALVTFVEQAGEVAPVPLPVAVTVAVDAVPGLRRDATTEVVDDARQQMALLADLLERSPIELSVALRPEIVETMANSSEPADRELVDRIAASLAGRHQLLSQPYLDVSPSWAVAASQVPIFRRQLVRGEDTIASLLGGAETDRTTWFTSSPIDTAGLDLLRELDVRQLVVDPDLLPVSSTVLAGGSDGRMRTVALGSGDQLPAMVGDARLDAQLRQRPANPALHAHYLLAELLGLHLEAQAAGFTDGPRQRALMVTIPDLTRVDPEVLLATLQAWTTNPRLAPMLAGRAIAAADRAANDGDAASISLPTPDLSQATELSFSIGRIGAALTSTTSILPAADARPERWRRLLDALPAQSISEETRATFVEQLDGEMGAIRASLSISEEDTTISLGGRRSKIPLVITNSSTTPLKVLVRLSSPKLEFPDGDQLVVIDESEPLTVPVVVKSSGRFRVTVQVLTADGTQVLVGDTPITVQATVLTGLAQVVTGAFLLILATWWAQHTLQARRRRQAAAAESQTHHPSAVHR